MKKLIVLLLVGVSINVSAKDLVLTPEQAVQMCEDINQQRYYVDDYIAETWGRWTDSSDRLKPAIETHIDGLYLFRKAHVMMFEALECDKVLELHRQLYIDGG